MRPKNKKHNIFTHRQQKIPRTKPQKRKNKQQQNKHYLLLFFIAFASTIQFSHNTPPHKQHPPRDLALSKGWFYRTTIRVAPDTQQHATKQNKPSKPEHKHTHPCFTDPPTRTTMRIAVSHLKTKTCHHFAPKPDTKQWQKTVTSQTPN